ncbi:MAG TPA: GNAT family N-acetyltransferase [Pseudonocardiaceae bacterium]|jgi:ribosomal protein S18 acetylase RimI-like enzyme
MAEAVIRPYQPTDRDAVYDVCLRTAAAGQDATGLHDDPDVVADVFAGPYVHLEPDFAFVLDDGGRAVGYVLGAPDTARFAADMREKWLPLVGAQHPDPVGRPAGPDQEYAYLLHHPERMVLPALADFPAHLHIDLLADYRRSGNGRRLIVTLLTALHDAGVPRVHLGMINTNTRARAFYDRLGFTELAVPDAGVITYLGRSTDVGRLSGDAARVPP